MWRDDESGGERGEGTERDHIPDTSIEAFLAARAAAFERLRVQSEIFRLEESYALPAVPGREV